MNKKLILRRLDAPKILAALRKHTDELKNFQVKNIALFGSFLKGRANRKSDLDFLVEFEERTFDNYINLKLFLERLFSRKIDLVTKESLKPAFRHVKREASYVKA